MLFFAATVFLVFKQPKVRIPFTSKRVWIDYGWAPLLAVFILLATRFIDSSTISSGVIGAGNVSPYSIIILIMSLSYICISLDYTGFFEYVSLKVVGASKNSGRKLFIYFFALTAFLTLFTDNDIVILTMTLIMFYISINAKINPIPFLFAQFFAVNILGMALYIGNPANIVAADAYGLSFAEFAKWMLLPSAFSALACLILLWVVFRRKIPRRFRAIKVEPGSSLRDKRGAIFGSAVLVLVIIFMSLPTSMTGVPIWGIALFFAAVMVFHDMAKHRAGVFKIFARLPWKVVPFLIGFFIMIEALVAAGWTDLFASQLSGLSGSVIITVFGVCFLTSLSAGVMSNHPMTIFFVRVFNSPSFAATQTTRLGATLGLVVGSNFGANLTLIGALAGIMWAGILHDKGIQISFSQFSKYGLLIMPLVTIVAGLTLIAEIMLFV
ncbi:MAG: SLC13 family permease [Candidatus Hadarchaeota archaeon]